ncbi:hypothetical protein KSB06_19515 [Acinetobacter baumannii]|nr:hypothetical protein [Acinetobacter baumannii]
MKLQQPLDVVNNCLISLPVPDTSFLNDTSIDVGMSCISIMLITTVISLIVLKILSFKVQFRNIALFSGSLLLGFTACFISFPHQFKNAMQPYQNALDLAGPTIKSVNDPLLNSLYVKGEKFSFPEYGTLAKKYNERSEVIKVFAIKNSCK